MARPTDRKAIIERAREQRLERGGLPVDDATLARVADAALDPAYPLPGLYLTFEEAADEVPDDLVDRLGDYLAARPDVDGGLRLGYRDGRRVVFAGIAGDPAEHEEALRDIAGDRVVAEQVPRTASELYALADRIAEEDEALQAAGYVLLVTGAIPAAGVVEVQVYGGPSAAAASAIFAERYGPAVRVDWAGPTRDREVPQPFDGWTSDGCRLTVLFGIGFNGERFGSARVVAESDDRVVVAVTRLEPVGPSTLIGGASPHEAELELSAPVGDRSVIDAATNEPRPLRR